MTMMMQQNQQAQAEAAELTVPAGYKQTEVGVIPKDWQVLKLEQVASFKNGAAHENCINEAGEYTVVNSKFISTEGRVEKKSKECRQPAFENDILMVMSDVPNGRAIAKCYLVHEDNTYTINQRICAISAKNDDPKYIFYKLNRNPFYLSFDDGAKQTNLRRQDVLDCLIPIPLKSEQTAIANALSDVDALLGSLEALIAKKQAIKTASMQQLLTGRTRLPQFALREDGSKKGYKPSELGEIPEDWEVFSLDHVADVIDPHPSHRAPPEVSNGIPFLGIGDFDEAGYLLKPDSRVVSQDVYSEHRTRYKLEDGLLGLGRVASIGKVVRLRDDLGQYAVSPTLGVINPKKIDKQYLFFYLNSEFVTDQFLKVMSGSTRSSVGMIVLRKLQILTPLPEEAENIGQVLSDLDSEIQALEQRLSKTRDLKQGMMQQLLTGKVRLPVEEDR